jgi:hypothetical protein
VGAIRPGPVQRLFPDPAPDVRRALAVLGDVIQVAHPIPPRHREGLPRQIRALSELLTSARSSRPPDYLSRPPLLAAYVHYFLPWNVYRQVRLLAGLPLALAEGARVVDLGAGPLTFALALWIARPDLRGRALQYLAVDRSGKALTAGERIFAAVAGHEAGTDEADAPRAAGGTVSAADSGPRRWAVQTRRDVLEKARAQPADLLVAANLVNELRRDGEEAEWAARLVDGFVRRLGPGGRLLLVETGLRAAARRLHVLRAAAIDQGLTPVAPCPHAATCPLPARRQTGWCHFAPRVTGAPRWLVDLSRRAGLPKERASLAFLLLAAQAPGTGGAAWGDARAGTGASAVRIVSGPLDLPAKRQGHYACRDTGLAVVRSVRGDPPLRPGDLLPGRGLVDAGRDPRSGGALLDWKKRG